MARLILTYGLISGLVIIAGIIVTLPLADSPGHAGGVWLGYLIMLVALSSIFMGVRQHRDQALDGVIRFWPAFGIGLTIAALASVVYVIVWEGYLALTHYSFMDEYVEQALAAKRAAGVTGAAYAKAVAEMQAMKTAYADPLQRLPMTFMEIFPVGLLVALVSAALLRNPKVLPSRAAG